MAKEHLRKPSLRMTQILADNVRAYRKGQNLSQEALAPICDLHRTYIGSVERGERNVTLSTTKFLIPTMVFFCLISIYFSKRIRFMTDFLTLVLLVAINFLIIAVLPYLIFWKWFPEKFKKYKIHLNLLF